MPTPFAAPCARAADMPAARAVGPASPFVVPRGRAADLHTARAVGPANPFVVPRGREAELHTASQATPSLVLCGKAPTHSKKHAGAMSMVHKLKTRVGMHGVDEDDETVEVFGKFKLTGKEQRWRYYGHIVSSHTVAVGSKTQILCVVEVDAICNDANKSVDQACETGHKKTDLMCKLKAQNPAKVTNCNTNITEEKDKLYVSKRKATRRT